MSAAATLRVSSELAGTKPARGEYAVTFCGVAALLLFAPLAFGATQPWSIFVLEGGADLVFVLWAVKQINSPDLRIQLNPLFGPMTVFGLLVLAQLVSGRTAYRHATLFVGLQWLAYAILAFLLIQCLRTTKQLQSLAKLVTVYGISIATFAILQSSVPSWLHYWPRVHSFSGIYGPYVNRNHYAGLMEMLLPVPLVISLSPRVATSQRALAAVAAAIMAGSVFLSGSRGGVISLSCEIVFLFLMLLKRRKAGLPFLSLFLGTTILVVGWLGVGQIGARFSSIRSGSNELAASTRLAVDRDCLRMFAANPLGFGLGTFSDVYPAYRSFYGDVTLDHAHDDYLELLVETGILGFATVSWFLVTLYRSAFKKLDAWEFNARSAASVGALVGVTGILVHSLVDFNLQIPANAAWFVVLCVVAAMEPVSSRHSAG